MIITGEQKVLCSSYSRTQTEEERVFKVPPVLKTWCSGWGMRFRVQQKGREEVGIRV